MLSLNLTPESQFSDAVNSLKCFNLDLLKFKWTEISPISNSVAFFSFTLIAFTALAVVSTVQKSSDTFHIQVKVWLLAAANSAVFSDSTQTADSTSCKA